jgi:hypothetical protein
MPTSRSPSRNPKAEAAPPARRRSYVLPIVIAVLAAVGVVASALPARLIAQGLPPAVHAEDFSGSIWHGAAGSVSYAGRNLGAIEWQLDPLGLLHLTANLDLHWVHRGVALAALAAVTRQGATATRIQGGGPIEDLQDVGVAAGWHGSFRVDIDELKTDFQALQAAHGTVTVANIAGAQIAGGADLGNYVLRIGDAAADAAGTITGQLSDAGGPLDLKGTITITPQQHTGLISGTLRERADAPAELRQNLADLASMRGRDAEGRIPLDLEFNF